MTSLAATLDAPRTDHEALVALDRAHLIHPVSAWRQHEQRGPTVLASAAAPGSPTIDGHELLDAFAGLWCVNVGYGQESVVQAATEQMRKLPYATGYFDFGSEPAIRLAAKLVEITPPSLTRVYLTLGGSEAVDAAVRFIVQYYNAHRPAGEEAVHFAGARLPRLVVDRRRADRAAGVPSRLRSAAADPALHPVAQPVPPSAGRRRRRR